MLLAWLGSFRLLLTLAVLISVPLAYLATVAVTSTSLPPPAGIVPSRHTS